jgi:hypothetical protein
VLWCGVFDHDRAHAQAIGVARRLLDPLCEFAALYADGDCLLAR